MRPLISCQYVGLFVGLWVRAGGARDVAGLFKYTLTTRLKKDLQRDQQSDMKRDQSLRDGGAIDIVGLFTYM